MWSDVSAADGQDVAFSDTYEKSSALTAFSRRSTASRAPGADDTTVVIDVRAAPRRTSSRCGGRSCPSTSGASSRHTTRRPVPGIRRRCRSGPFEVVEWQKGKFIRAVANKDDWGGKPRSIELVFQVYTNQETLAQDLKLGIRLAIGIRRRRVKALQGDAVLGPGPARRRRSTTCPSTAKHRRRRSESGPP